MTASASRIASATATFTVVSLGTVTGTGIPSHLDSTTSDVFVSAASGGYVSCTGTTTTPDANFPTDSNSGPFLAVQIGYTASTGVISTNTPGESEANSVHDPCNSLGGNTYVASVTSVYTLGDVAVNVPGGQSVSGGLTITSLGTTTGLSSCSVNTAPCPSANTTTNANTLTHWTITGTGGLAGVTGTGEGVTITTTVGVSSTVSSTYSVN